MTDRPPQTLARRLTTGDAVVIGLGAMIGAGMFAAPGPAAAAGGTWMLAGLAIAAGVAYANATSSAQLAALHPGRLAGSAGDRRADGPPIFPARDVEDRSAAPSLR